MVKENIENSSNQEKCSVNIIIPETWSRSSPGDPSKIRRRGTLTNGECNGIQKKTTRRIIRFLRNIVTALIDAQWRWTLLVIALTLFFSWLLFALIWWLIALIHGDLEPSNQADNGWIPCVYNTFSFKNCFLFSIEVQQKVVYGGRNITGECHEAEFMMYFQSSYGVVVTAFILGILFTKISRTKQRHRRSYARIQYKAPSA